MKLTNETIEIDQLPLIDPAATPELPSHMECRLLHSPDIEPAIVLYHPKAEMHLLIRLTDLDNLGKYVEQLNRAVLKQAMGETPDGNGYFIDP